MKSATFKPLDLNYIPAFMHKFKTEFDSNEGHKDIEMQLVLHFMKEQPFLTV